MGKVKVTYRKKDTVPIGLNFISALIGADTSVYEAVIEVAGKKYRGIGETKEKAFERAMSLVPRR